MIQINPLKSYIDGGVRAAITTPPSASLVFDLPGKAIWVKGVKLKGTDHTYTFSHDNYITLTNTSNSNESEDIKIGVNTSALKNAIDTTYGVVSTTTNGLAPKFTSENKLAASTATTYYFLGWTGSTLKWYQAPFRNVRINSETTDRLGVNNTDPLIISSGNGISVTWDSTNKKIVITNTQPDVNHNTHYTTMLYIGENNDTKANKNVANPYLKLFDDSIRRATFQIKAGSGIAVASDANGNITITNSSPDVNHNTDRTGIKLATVSGTKKTDDTLILANSATGLNIQGGTNKFLIGDGTNYIEVPVTPSFTVSNKDTTIGTTLTTIATIAGVDIKAKIASYSLSNHTHSVKINGSTKTITTSGTIDLGNYLPLSGGTMSGSIYIPNSASIIHTTNSTSNWVYISELFTGSSESATDYQAGIGWHNTGGSGNGALTLIPYAQNSIPWQGNVGLYIAQNSLKFNGTAISLVGHTHAWNSLTHSSTTLNQAILTNGSTNGWKLYTLNISGWDNAANNVHSHSNKSVLDGITSTLVNNWNTAYNFVNTINGTDTDKVINKWDEIVNFLAGISEDDKLNTLLNSKLSVYKLADNTNVGAIKNNGIYYSTSDASSGTLVNSPFNTGFTLINMTSIDGGDDLRRSRLAFNAYGEIKVSNDRGLANIAETWYNILTSKNTYVSENKGYINGVQITYVNNAGNATNATNATNARKLINWYSTRPTSLNTQFGDGSLRIFHATSSTTEGKSPTDATILHLAWDNNGGWDSQLAVNSLGKVYSRGQNAGTWQSWKTLAFTTDIPTSLKNPYSLTTFGVVYDGSAAKTVTTSTFISLVTEGTSTITDGTMFITSYASNSGFADTNAVNVPYKRKASHLWDYIKAKTDSLYTTKGHNHDDRYLKLTGGIMTGTINRRSGGSTISGRDHAIIRLTYAPGGSSWNPIVCVDTETGTWTLGHLSSESSNTSFHFCFSTNADYNAGNNVGNYVILRNKVGIIALTSEIPSSLKNPYSLTLLANGTTLATYDGSVSKIVNLTYDNVGAAAKNHIHNSLEPWDSYITGDSHATALKSIFDKNKTSIPRNKFISMYSAAYGNGSYYMGYFLSGYENTPYGGFFVAHYDAAYYIGIANGSFTQHRLVYSTDIPNSLKNPHALTISLNGTSQGPYDGSAAKSINITPSSIGAATSGHNHDDRYLKLTGGTMQLGEGLKFHADENYFGTYSDARIISLLDGNGTTCDGGLIIDERATYNGTEYVTELLRIRDAEFKWKGLNILHTGNSDVSGGGSTWGSSITVKINGTSKTLTIPSNPNTDYRVTQSETTTSNYRPLVVGYTNVSTAGSGMTGSVTEQVYLSNKFYVQPSTGNLYATTFVGTLLGNATSATNADTLDGYHANSFSLAGHNHDGRYLRWNGSTADISAMGWGTLTAANGYTILSHAASSDGGDMGFVNKGGQIFMQLDGYYYLREGKYRVLDTSDFTAFSNVGSLTTRITIGGITKDLKIDADLLDGQHGSRYTRALGGPNYITINVGGNADTYYPVVISNVSDFYPMLFVNISRTYNETAPDTWNTSTHKGGLTLTLLWNGSRYWDGNSSGNACYCVYKNESYSTMVGGLGNAVEGKVVWLRGGGAVYHIHSMNGTSTSVTVYTSTYTDSANRSFAPKTTPEVISIRWPGYTQGADYATSAGNADTVDGQHFSYSNSSNSPTYLWATNSNGSSFLAARGSISVNYANSAGNADTVDGYHADSFYKIKSLRSDKDSIYDLRYNYGTYDKGDYNGTYKDEYPTNYGTYLALTHTSKNGGALMFFDAPTNNVLGHIYVRTRGAGDSNTIYSEWGKLAYITDNVASATKLTSSAGSASLPIYFSDGKPVACTASSLFSNLSNSGNNISVTIAGLNRTLTVNYASNASSAEYLNNYSIGNPNTEALKDNKVKWFAQINLSSGYAGNNYGFPVGNNANGILYLGTHPGKYGHQLGFSSNGNIYHRFQNGSDFSSTANGGSWSVLLTSTNYASILDSRYYTELEVNNLLSNKLNISNFNWTNLSDKIIAGNEFNIVNAGFNSGMWFNYLPINDRSKTATISGYHFGNGATGYTSIIASGFIKNGSSSSYVLLGDGGHKAISDFSMSHSHPYLPLSGGTITGTLGKNNNYIFKPNGGDFRTTIEVYTGAICISLPANIGNTMLSMWIDVYNYSYNKSFSVHVGGYTYTNSTFLHSPFAMVYGASHKVRLTYNNGFKIYIGEINTTWYYPQISIRDVVLGFGQNYSNWYNDWSISFVTSFPSINTEITRYTITTDNIGSQSVNYASSAGNADTLDNYHANGLLTALSNSNNGVSITVGGTTKSISNISVNYASSAGNADKVDGLHFNWNNNKNDHTYLWAASDNGNAYLVHRASISVNYATYARYVYCTSDKYLNFQWSGLNGQPTWLFGSNDGLNVYVWNPSNFSVYKANKSDQLEAYTSWGFTDPGRFVRAIRYNGWHTRLYMGYYRDATLENTVHVGYADDADTLDGKHASAFALVGHTHNYDNVYSKLGHTHDDRYYTESEINSKLSAYLPLAGGTMTGLIKGNNKGGSWIHGRANAALYQPRNVQGDWHPVVGFKTKTGSWEFGSVGYDDNASFSWESDTNYNSGTNTTTVVYLRNTSGTIALTSEIPTVTNYYWADMKVSSTSSTSTSPTFSTCYTSNWFRSTGLTGWYNETYAGGWYMTDTSWVRTYNSKGIYTNTGTIYNLGHAHLACNNGYNVGIGTTSPSYKLHVSGDSYATGWSRAASGFYCQDTGVHFTHNDTKGQIAITSNNEFCWGANSNILYFNYAASSLGTTVTLYVWNAGSSSSYASHTMGHITLGNGNYLLKRVGSSSSWYNGRDKAIIRQTSNAGDYCVMMSSKTTSGSWEIGNEYDDLCFTHITDSNYNSRNNNYLGQIVFTSDGEVYAAHFYENSDIRYKKILKNLSINSNTIANLPLFDFKWIENNSIGTGTSAQAVLLILPNLVSGTDKLTLDYGVLGTIAGITACKELVIQKSELLQLKEKVKLLEDKLRKYENI